MKNLRSSLSLAVVGCFLIFSWTLELSAKESGFYVHGGVTYWNDLEPPESETVDELADVQFDFEIDGSRARLLLGAGYNFNQKWGAEVFYAQTPEGILKFEDPESTITGSDEPFPLTISTNIQHTIIGINAVYDMFVNENLSVFGKFGVAFLQADIGATLISIGDEEMSFRTQDAPIEFEDDNTQELLGAIGVRFPIKRAKASMTVAFQFIGTSDDRETTFEVGFQKHF